MLQLTLIIWNCYYVLGNGSGGESIYGGLFKGVVFILVIHVLLLLASSATAL